MRWFYLVSCLAAFIIFNSPASVESALKSANRPEELKPEAVYNPHPDKKDKSKEKDMDFILPMPENLQYVMRIVLVPAKGVLKDHSFKMGVLNLAENRDYYEKQYDGYVSAPFRFEDLPTEWQNRLSEELRNDFLFYFIGKYELSNGQWDAVMGEKSGEAPDKPKTGISWYDMQNFLNAYNQWLLANHPKALPMINDDPGYLRLPSEAEWEFAARGGNISQGEGGLKDNPYEGDRIENYAVFREENPKSIGSRKPNRLGIYDLAGNVSELVQDGFRFIISDLQKDGKPGIRFHGAEGGLVSKGGNFNTEKEEELYPGKRIEAKMFQRGPDGAYVPFKDRTLGVRFVLSNLNVPNSERNKLIKEEQAALDKSRAPVGQVVQINQNGDPLVELARIYDATDSEITKKNLEQLRGLLKDYNEAYARARDSNLLHNLRSVAYMGDSLSNIAFRCYEAQIQHELAKLEKGYNKEIGQKFQTIIDDHYKNLKYSTNVYRVNVNDLSQYPREEIESKLNQLRQQYQGKDKVNTNQRHYISALKKHIELVNAKGASALGDLVIWQDVVPGKQTLDLLNKMKKKEAR